MFNNSSTTVFVQCLPSDTKASPDRVLNRMKRFIVQEGLDKGDEAWLVVDQDDWTESQLRELWNWSQTKPEYNLAVSNPCFEYWLLLHFDTDPKVTSVRNCITKLKKFLPEYTKSKLETHKLQSSVHNAIQGARIRDNPPCIDWPHTNGTTVYRLVERILMTKIP